MRRAPQILNCLKQPAASADRRTGVVGVRGFLAARTRSTASGGSPPRGIDRGIRTELLMFTRFRGTRATCPSKTKLKLEPADRPTNQRTVQSGLSAICAYSTSSLSTVVDLIDHEGTWALHALSSHVTWRICQRLDRRDPVEAASVCAPTPPRTPPRDSPSANSHRTPRPLRPSSCVVPTARETIRSSSPTAARPRPRESPRHARHSPHADPPHRAPQRDWKVQNRHVSESSSAPADRRAALSTTLRALRLTSFARSDVDLDRITLPLQRHSPRRNLESS